MTAPFPARLHAIIARDAPKAIVFRRGPSKRVCTVLWDLKTDSFTLGQWLNGRIYERRSDISPDGRLLIYFAMNGKWSSETGGAWTAVSRAPWLKAIALFGKSNCWNGGGLFTSNRSYWLNTSFGETELRNSDEVRLDTQFRRPTDYGGECPGVYYLRLQRDGWKLRENTRSSATFDKPLRRGWVLTKIAHAGFPGPGHGCYWDEHELTNTQTASHLLFPDWEWAEVENESLVYAQNGCLFRQPLKSNSELDHRTCLFDFNDMVFEPIEAPY